MRVRLCRRWGHRIDVRLVGLKMFARRLVATTRILGSSTQLRLFLSVFVIVSAGPSKRGHGFSLSTTILRTSRPRAGRAILLLPTFFLLGRGMLTV